MPSSFRRDRDMATDVRADIDAARWRDLSIERTVLGQVLAFPDTAAAFTDAGCTRDSFSDPVHQAIFAAIADVRQEGLMPDLPTIGTRLREARNADISPAYLADLVSGVPKPAPPNITAQVERLASISTVRELANAPTVRRTGARASYRRTTALASRSQPGRRRRGTDCARVCRR